VFRHRDAENYYSARVDADLQRVVLSVVERGHERILAHAPARLDPPRSKPRIRHISNVAPLASGPRLRRSRNSTNYWSSAYPGLR
jgi:hypothetical protein